MAYHYAKNVTVTDEPEALPRGLRWVTLARDGKPPYMVRSDAGGMSTRTDHCDTLTEARKLARSLARGPVSTWAEVFRWAESGVMLREHFVCSYERELSAGGIATVVPPAAVKWQDVNPRAYAKPTALLVDFGHADGHPRFCVVGTEYGYLHTAGGDVRTWRSKSGAQRAIRNYASV